jgi:hypothetical protein
LAERARYWLGGEPNHIAYVMFSVVLSFDVAPYFQLKTCFFIYNFWSFLNNPGKSGAPFIAMSLLPWKHPSWTEHGLYRKRSWCFPTTNTICKQWINFIIYCLLPTGSHIISRSINIGRAVEPATKHVSLPIF